MCINLLILWWVKVAFKFIHSLIHFLQLLPGKDEQPWVRGYFQRIVVSQDRMPFGWPANGVSQLTIQGVDIFCMNE